MFKEKLQAVKIQITTINFTTPCLSVKTLCDLLINQKFVCIQGLFWLYSEIKLFITS